MKRYGIYAIVLLALLFLLAGSPVPAVAASFEKFSFSGMEELVKASKGKVVMINFFATWCPPCREEIPSLIRIRKDFGEDKLVIIGASLDEDMAALEKYAAKTGFNYPVKLAGRDLVHAAGVSGIPHMLIFNGKGEVVGNAAGLVPEKDLRDFLQSHME